MDPQPTPKLNRRKFLKLAGVTLGVSAAACCGLGAVGTYSPKARFIENHYQGEKKMIETFENNEKTLSKNNFYKDALIYHLIHMGYKKELAELKVERMIRKKQKSLD